MPQAAETPGRERRRRPDPAVATGRRPHRRLVHGPRRKRPSQILEIPVTLAPPPASSRVIRAREDRWFDRFRRTGDPRLLAKVFDRTAPELWKVASHLCRDQHAAEDAVQGTFLAAIESQGSWDGERPLLPWLLGMLVHRVRDGRRRQVRQPDPARVVPPTGERDPAELAGHGEFGEVLRTALQRVPEPYRTPLQRHLVHGIAAHEIAAEAGVPASTVRMQLHRGLDHLRQRLPAGFAGGTALLVLTPQAFAAMRRVVLTSVPGGAEVAAVATGSAGHFTLGWLGVILMKKTLLAVVAGLVLAGSFWEWQQSLGAGGPALAPVVSTTVRPLAAASSPPNAPVDGAGDTGRRDVAPRAPQAARGRLRVVLQMDGTARPIPGFSLDVAAGLPGEPTPRDGRLPPGFPAAGHIDYGSTDASGVATFELPRGVVQLTGRLLPDAKPWYAEVKADHETELKIVLPVRITAEVQVVDEQGRALAGARILGRTFGDVGHVVERELGRTDGDGRWREAFAESGVPIRAVHDGYVASRAVDLGRDEARVQLVLATGPAQVAGTVHGLDGRPLARAQVTIQARAPGFAGQRPLALVADEAGRFTSAHVPPGPITVFAMSPIGVAEQRCARSDAVVAAGRAHEVDVRFTAGARVVATLRGHDGKPVVDQHVAAVLQPEAGLWVHFAGIGAVTALTDATGVAQLTGLLPGEYEVQAFTPAGVKRAKLQLGHDQEERIDWTLGASAWAELQVVDGHDRPLAGVRVALHPEAGTLREARSDAEGLVRFQDIADQPHQVVVSSPDGSFEQLRTAAALRTRTVLRLPEAGLPTATLHGRIHTEPGLVAATITAELLRLTDGRPDGSRRQALDESLTFRFDGLPPGTYMLGFRRGDREYLGAPQQFVLAAGATLDAGSLALAPPLDVEIVVTAADQGPVAGAFVAAALPERPRHFGHLPQTRVDGGVQLRNVPNGRYELLVWGEDVAPQFLPLVATPAQAQMTVQMQRATPTRFLWQGRGVSSLVLERDGVELLRLQSMLEQPTLGLLPGRYTIDVEVGGARGKATFVVGAKAGAPVEVPLAK